MGTSSIFGPIDRERTPNERPVHILVVGISPREHLLHSNLLAHALLSACSEGMLIVDIERQPPVKEEHILSLRPEADLCKIIKKMSLAEPAVPSDQGFYAKLFKKDRAPRMIRATRSRR